MKIIDILTKAYGLNVSDVHICGNESAQIRLDGSLGTFDDTIIPEEEIVEFFTTYLSSEQLKQAMCGTEIDVSIEIKNVARFRVNIYRKLSGLAASFRAIKAQPPSLKDIGAPPVFSKFAGEKKGLILVTGPTGCGKSTTLAALIDAINSTKSGHIITIEDPIEYIHTNKKCLVSQRELQTHTCSFSSALRAALREDPDYILVGEMRDLETMQLALTAAETGHLVFATLHTMSAVKTIDRIIDSFPAAQQNQVRSMLSESLTAVIAQTLCKKKQGGRVAAFEILISTPAVRNLIREGKSHLIENCLQTGQAFGMQTMENSLKELENRGIIC